MSHINDVRGPAFSLFRKYPQTQSLAPAWIRSNRKSYLPPDMIIPEMVRQLRARVVLEADGLYKDEACS